MNLRHEWKHRISYSDMIAVRQRMSAVASPDSHTPDGTYMVRSLYFDNLQDKVLREKLDGVSKREKFRIRYYNGDTSLIHLEKKSKLNGLCGKQSEEISEEQVQEILAGCIRNLNINKSQLIEELCQKMLGQGLRPKTIVDYTRQAFVYAPGNVRVTLDYDIRTGIRGIDFLNPDCVTVPAGDAPIILEVKWDAFLPDVIRHSIQLPGRQSTPFSKYAACRVYG